MSKSPDELWRPVEVWFPALIKLFPQAFSNALAAQLLLGERKKIERSSDVKGAVRHLLRGVCEDAAPFLTLHEANECETFDYVHAEWDGTEVAFRWGRIPSEGPIRRNDTKNSNTTRGQASLFPGMDKQVGELPLFTLGYTVEDDFTLGGVPRGWMGKLQLCREWYDDTEIVHTIAVYAPPSGAALGVDDATVVERIRARTSEEDELRRIVRNIRKTA